MQSTETYFRSNILGVPLFMLKHPVSCLLFPIVLASAIATATESYVLGNEADALRSDFVAGKIKAGHTKELKGFFRGRMLVMFYNSEEVCGKQRGDWDCHVVECSELRYEEPMLALSGSGARTTRVVSCPTGKPRPQ